MGGVLSILLVECWSRRDKFKAGKKLIRKCRTHACRQKLRCREPNRILQKVLTRVFRKSRKLRRLVRQAISKNSRSHCTSKIIVIIKIIGFLKCLYLKNSKTIFTI